MSEVVVGELYMEPTPVCYYNVQVEGIGLQLIFQAPPPDEELAWCINIVSDTYTRGLPLPTPLPVPFSIREALDVNP